MSGINRTNSEVEAKVKDNRNLENLGHDAESATACLYNRILAQ